MIHPNDIKRIATALLAVAAIGALRPGLARADVHIVCPPSMQSNQITVTSPAGWTGYYTQDAEIKLDSAEAMLGPIQLNGVLIGEKYKRKDGMAVSHYSLTGGDSAQLEKWIVCNYGGSLQQASKLPITTKECTVLYRPVKGAKGRVMDYAVSDITCK